MQTVIRIKKRRVRQQFSDRVFQAVALLFAVMILFPFLWLLLSSLKTNAEYYVQPSPIFPRAPQWTRYKYVFIDLQFYRYMINSVWLATVCVVLNVFSSAFVGYGFSRFRFRGKRAAFVVMLMTMFLPAQVTFIPQFMIFTRINWVDTYFPIIMPQLFGAACNILLISQFMKGIPREMDEAAKMDGAGYMRIFMQIILPQTLSALIVVAISAFLGSWKDSMGPLIYLRTERLYTVPVALMFFQAPDQNSYLYLLTGVVLSIIPTILVYVLSQKYMDKGIYIAELK